MPLETPTIDDRRYDDLVDEVRARVPRYTSEWTDLNDSDPGMTFIQLFAWLSDMMIYRLGKVPELNYIKFLELLGFRLAPAESSIAEITFPVRADFTNPTLIIPLRTQIESEEPDEQGPIIFETDVAFNAIRAALTEVLVETGSAFASVTAQNTDVQESFEPFGSSTAVGHALLLGFSEELPQVDLDLAVSVDGEQIDDTGVECGLGQTKAHASATIAWEYWDGRRWTETAQLDDETVAFTRSGHVRIKTPSSGSMKATKIGAVTTSLYWLRARLVESAYESAVKLLTVRTNTVSATQAETIRDEIIGGSDAAPNQTFKLTNAPVLDRSLSLGIDEGRDDTPAWTEVDDLFGCGPDDRCFTLDRTTGTIRFGDGLLYGAIPLANPEKPGTSIIAKEYRIGGGARGNVATGALNGLLTSITGLDEANITNLFAAHSGSDEETIEAAQVRARLSLKSRCRAVTSEDFELLAMEAANIARAKALPLYHPSFPGIELPGAVSVIIVPDSETPNPMPSEGTLRTVCEYLDQRRLLTTEVYVIRPAYRHVEIKGDVIAEDTADLAEVFNAIEATLDTFLHPLRGGRDGTGWPFGGAIYYSQVLQQVATITGVSRVDTLTLVIDGDEQPPCTDVAIERNELVYATGHSAITVQYEVTSG